ncbi:ABC transporter permease [Thermasporomyces composti]|uniref:Peptide/nickel transport system permease protein n=1 Tax=Thermasporomyces composti TaxID=696763 RepID=A0A3D9V974_THECX|nr:ABC transporter permease [Thermasporomyces composti]REF37253.1 peptide/nickel transport system permease protein [Thermasporomyces composti]
MISRRYLVRRILLLVTVMWTAASINFFIPKLSPRDPIRERLMLAATQGGRNQTGLEAMVEAYNQQFGLDQPLWKQYLTAMLKVVRFDYGYSISQYPRTVNSIIKDALPWTLGLGLMSILIAFVIGTLLGALLGWPRCPRWLRIFVPASMLTSAVPAFVLGFLLIYLFAFQLKIFPLSGAYSRTATPEWSLEFALDIAKHAFLPACALVLFQLGGQALQMRSLMVMTVGEDYITFAEAKGLRPRRIFARYAVRNAMLPQVTGLVMSLGTFVFSTVLVETLFAYPGLGGLINGSIQVLDYNLLYGITMILVFAVCIATLIVDLIYPLLDPRIRYEKG